MHQPYADPYVMFGILDLELDDDRPTWPPAGSANMIIEDRCEPLFITATWSVIATVGDLVISRSKSIDKAHTVPFIRRWSRQLIRTRYELLRRLGVDAESEYVRLGGDLQDLKP